MTDEAHYQAVALFPNGDPHFEAFGCGHPNVFGCPNHGELARSLVRPLPRVVKLGYEQAGLLLCPPEAWPVPYRVTQRGRDYLAGREFKGEAWE